jgi:hypothetical protein
MVWKVKIPYTDIMTRSDFDSSDGDFNSFQAELKNIGLRNNRSRHPALKNYYPGKTVISCGVFSNEEGGLGYKDKRQKWVCAGDIKNITDADIFQDDFPDDWLK